MTARRHMWALVGAALLTTLPFAYKAFHIDDAAYVEIAEGLRRAPFAPLGGEVALDEKDRAVFAVQRRAAEAFEVVSHPPLVPYLIAGGAWLAGGMREVPQHLLFAAFPVLAAVSLYRLAARMVPRPIWPAAFVVTSPVFVLSGQGLMTDMPMLALSLLSLAAFTEGIAVGSLRWIALAGLAAGMAILTRYVALGLLPLLCALELSHRRRADHAAAAVAIAAAIAGAWALHNWVAHGTLHLFAAGRHYLSYYAQDAFSLHGAALKALCDLAAVGGALIAPVLLSALDRPRAAAAALGAGALLVFANPLGVPELLHYTAGQRAALAAFLGAGVFALVLAVVRLPAAGPWPGARPFLTIWLAGALLSAIVLLPFGASRYTLPAVAPLALLAFGGDTSARPVGWAAAVAANLALSLALSMVDWAHADSYRSFARSFRPPERVWFVGEWGFRHYMRQEGNHYLRADDRTPVPGEWIVRAELAGLHDIDPDLKVRAPVDAVSEATSAVPLRLLGFAAKAGFYSHAWGLLPYSLSRAPLERFEIRRVSSGGAP